MNVKAIVGGRLIDCTGAAPISDSVILIEGKKIKAVGKSSDVEIPPHADIIEAGGKTVMPGLIDSHLHNFGRKTDNFVLEGIVRPQEVSLIKAVFDCADLIGAGFTTVKDCGGENGLHLKMALEEGTIRGPRILASGLTLSQTFGHGDQHYFPIEYAKKLTPTLCDGVDECMKAARLALRRGADFIKVCTTGGVLSQRDRPEHTQFTLEEIKAIVQEAQKVGTFVTSHAQGTEGIKNALKGGIRTVDHVFYPDDECMNLAKEKGAVFVTTLSIMRRIIEGGVEAGYPSWGVEKAAEAWETTVRNIGKAYRAGVTIASATDFIGSPLLKMGTNAMELELLVKHCGFTPMDALIAATRNGAKACAMEDRIGAITPGRLADIVIVKGDPLADVALLQETSKIALVMKEGSIETNRMA